MVIQYVNQLKCLGIILDYHLSFESHINYIHKTSDCPFFFAVTYETGWNIILDLVKCLIPTILYIFLEKNQILPKSLELLI